MSQQNINPGYTQQTSSLAVISLIAGIASFFIVPILGIVCQVSLVYLDSVFMSIVKKGEYAWKHGILTYF